MRINCYLSLIALGTIAAAVAACAPAAPAMQVDLAGQLPAPEVAVAPAPPPAEAQAEQPGGSPLSANAVYRTGQDQLTSATTGRLIVKDGQVKLLVTDTDAAIDGVMQVVADLGGYVVSSRVWFQPLGETNYKYGTITLGVPASDFERAIRRLRSLGIRVLDETTSGQDVTDEFVDLQSRLESLQATRARILTFLEQANTVEEALRVNQELSAVEAQIEEVQGRMNYLSGRSAYSTITVNLEPELSELTPTPTATPTPTPTPEPWEAGRTFRAASSTLAELYRGIADLAIWLVVVVLPVVAPFALIGWIVWLVMRRRRPPKPEDDSSDGA